LKTTTEFKLNKSTAQLKRVFILLFVIMGLATITSAQIVLIKGKLYESDSFSKIPFAIISLKGKMTAVTSDESGYFEINCARTDTLHIRHISYQIAYFPVKKFHDSSHKIVKLYLKKKQVSLNQIIVSGNRLREDKKEEYKRHLERVKPSISNPVSAIYETFSRRGKERTKMDEIYQRLLFRDELEARLPPQKLWLITYDRSVKVDDLLLLCPISSYFLKYSSDYEFYYHFNKCWEQYKRSR